MKNYNPVSKTSFEYTKDRIQHYSKDKYECMACGHSYHPKIYSQPYVIQFGIVILVLLAMLFLLLKAAVLATLVTVGCVIYLFYYQKKERKLWAGKGSRKPKYGEIVLDCPKCCHDKAVKKFK